MIQNLPCLFWLLLVCLQLTPACAQNEIDPPTEEWHYSLRDLRSAGVSDDAASLIHVVREHDDPQVRWKAVHVLTGRRETAAVPVFEALLEDTDLSIRHAAASGLVALGEPAGIEALRSLLAGSATPSLKVSIAGELARSGDSSGWSLVSGAAAGGISSDRLLAAVELPSFADPDLRHSLDGDDPCELMARLADDEVLKVRRRAVMNLAAAVKAGCAANAFDHVLERLGTEPDEDLRQRAEQLRRQLSERTDLQDGDGQKDF